MIKSISGIRGTIGGAPGDSLTPLDIARYALAFGTWIQRRGGNRMVIGRDARISGPMVHHIVTGNLMGLGIEVLDLGMATTPTVEMAVLSEGADAGIILTASHNPREWNALKLLNDKGEFISAEDGAEVLEIAERGIYEFAPVDRLGKHVLQDDYLDRHISEILALDLVDREAVAAAGFTVAVDAINSVGGIAVPRLLESLGVKTVHLLHGEPTGEFAHNPEPLPEHLRELSDTVRESLSDIGISVDPDVDRLVLIDETGTPIGEEYTLVTVADYVLQHRTGPTVSNLSSSRALRDVTERYGENYYPSAVGEMHVVSKMKEVGAVIGGEGNGGIIVPELHYGRDSLVGIALVLSYMANSGRKLSELRASYPNYEMYKAKAPLDPGTDIDGLLQEISRRYVDREQIDVDGLKIHFGNDWVHLRRSNTEPIIRVYAESRDKASARELADRIRDEIHSLLSRPGKP